MILIDTNIILELLLNRPRADDCENLLEAASKGRIEAVVTHFSIHAVEAVLKEQELILRLLRNLENSLGISVHDTTITDEVAVTILMNKVDLNFDDCLQYFVAKKLGVEAIVSFGKHFDGLDMPRLEPKDVLLKLV